MQTILIAVLVLTQVITWFIFIDIILSWISIFAGKRLKIPFISSIIEPIYEFIRKHIPTNLGPFDFSPIILLFALILIQGLVFAYDPSLRLVFMKYLQL